MSDNDESSGESEINFTPLYEPPWLRMNQAERAAYAREWVTETVPQMIQQNEDLRAATSQSVMMSDGRDFQKPSDFTPWSKNVANQPKIVRLWRANLLWAARTMRSLYPRKAVAVVNMACSDVKGGNFLNGGTGLEDQLLINTSLFHHLPYSFYNPGRVWAEGDLIFSQNVRVIRSGAMVMLPEKRQYWIDVISSEAVRHPQVTKDNEYQQKAQRDAMRKKIQDIMYCAVKRGVRHLIFGPYGCSLGHPPSRIAELMVEVMMSFDWKKLGLEDIIIVLPEGFAGSQIWDSFCKVFKTCPLAFIDRDGLDLDRHAFKGFRNESSGNMCGPIDDGPHDDDLQQDDISKDNISIDNNANPADDDNVHTDLNIGPSDSDDEKFHSCRSAPPPPH